MKLTTDQLSEFRRLRGLADNAAFRLGVLRAEYSEREKQILIEIDKHYNSQKEFGEQMLSTLKLDVEKEEYTIDEDGEVKRLDAGVWVNVE